MQLGDTLSFLMARANLSPSSVAERIGRDISLVEGLISGTVSIDRKLAMLLSANVGGSASFWTARQAHFDQCVDRMADQISAESAKRWVRFFPVKEMVAMRWVGYSGKPTVTFKSLLAYFDVTGPDEWSERYNKFQNSFSFRASSVFDSQVGAISAWLRQAEIRASSLRVARWQPQRFRTQLVKIRALTKAKELAYFLPRLQRICAEAGVAAVFVKAPSGCRASGAARFLSPDKAVIVLSFRHLSDDHFWFTFFHEAGHLLLHGDRSTFVDGDDTGHTDKEAQANSFAASMLVPTNRMERMLELRPRSLDVIRYAVSIGTAPGIVVGQMQNHGVVPRSHLNKLKRRYTWEQIDRALS